MDLTSSAVLNAVLLLLAGAVGLLVSVMTQAGAWRDHASPARRGLAHWLPIGITGLVAAALGHGEMGIGLALGTSVAVLSAVTGFIAMAGPVQPAPGRVRRVWAFLPASALLVFVVGLHGTAGPFEAIVLLAQGALALNLWLDVRGAHGPEPSSPRTSLPLLTSFAALALAAVAAWAAVRGAELLAARDAHYPTATIAGTILSIVLAMPMVSTGSVLAGEGRGWEALTAQVAVVYLNLCLLIPLALLIPGAMEWAGGIMAGAPTTSPWAAQLFPRAAWRIDALAAVILALLYVPLSSGRVRLDRGTAGWLVVAYFIYLLAMAVANLRM